MAWMFSGIGSEYLKAPSRSRSGAARGALFAALAATCVVAPFLRFGNSSGHDFEIHMQSWLEVSRQWQDGILFPRWAAGANFAYGEPRFIFYPPISWILGAALGRVMPWPAVPGAMDWLSLLIAGMAAFHLARDWLAPAEAAGAAVLYAMNPYNLLMVYSRSDFGELLAAALYPLLLRDALRLKRRAARAVISLAIVFALIWLANAPAGVIAAYSLALILLVEALQEKAMHVLFAGGGAMAAGFGLAALYVIPAAYERRWVQISQAVSDVNSFDRNFLFARIKDPEFWAFNHYVSWIALAVMIASLLAAAGVAGKRAEMRSVFWPLAALAAASAFLMFPASAFAWRILPEMQFLQFPWRWLGPLNAALAFFAAAALGRFSRKWIAWGLALIVLLAAGVTMARHADWDSDAATDIVTASRDGTSYEGLYEYAPAGSRIDQLAQTQSQVAVVQSSEQDAAAAAETQIQIQVWRPEQKSFFVQAPRPVTLAVHLLNYPAWRIWINGQRAAAKSDPANGQMRIELPAGASSVDVIFARTRDRWLGGAISLLSLLTLAVTWLFLPRHT